MQWLDKVVDEVMARQPEGEIIVESGVSPSGTYHVGTLREVLTQDAILWELHRRGRSAKHVHYVDDLDPLRKIPVNVPPDFQKYLGRPYCGVPAPDGSNQSYADYFLNDFLTAAKALNLEMEVVRSHQRYRGGFMVPAIEKALAQTDEIARILTEVSGRKLDENWSPIQVMEDQYLKSRKFISLDKTAKTIEYLDNESRKQVANYQTGAVKLNWRIDWPARWWLLKVAIEPFGRDHATKGGSYDTGAAIARQVFGAEPPIPVPYHFINLTGETKKMSKSTGNIIAISELVQIIPPEVVRFFVLRAPPAKQLFFDQVQGVMRLIDEFGALLAKEDKTDSEKRLVQTSTNGVAPTVSRVPFSHLVASYQAALKDPDKTLDVLSRTEYREVVDQEREIIKKELAFIDRWLAKWAPPEVKFQLLQKVDPADFSEAEKSYLRDLSAKIAQAPADADGAWFHQAIYELDGQAGLAKQQLFTTLYKALIGQQSGPRAGWFLSILPRDWLIKRLRFEA